MPRPPLPRFGNEIITIPHHLCLYHVANSLVEGVDLVGLEVTDDGTDVVQYLFDEWHHLQTLYLSVCVW